MIRKQSESNHINNKKTWFIIITTFLTILLYWILGELFLRLIPIPGVQFDAAKYDNICGARFYPNTVVTYRNTRGDFVKRETNQWGYLDKEHEKEKQADVFRIGFFGDSYTEAKQVPLEQTFYRLIENNLKTYRVECLAFGVSGFGTLQSYLNSKRWADFFDLDMVVYVFYENDPGDMIKEIKRSPNLPYPILTDNGLQVDYSFREINKHREKLFFKISDYLTANSLMLATISSRIRLLRKHGIKVQVPNENMESNANKKVATIPDGDNPPSIWPQPLRMRAQKLLSAVILKWKNEINNNHKDFVIIYIPRHDIFKKNIDEQDTWKLWLDLFCKKENIMFIDPTSYLIEMELTGKEIFFDHFTKEGHEAFSRAFLKWFNHKSIISQSKGVV